MPKERTGPCADTTNVRSSAAAVTPVNDTYGLGGVTSARTAPVWVDLSSAAVSTREEASRWRSGSRRTARSTSWRSSRLSTAASADPACGWYRVTR